MIPDIIETIKKLEESGYDTQDAIGIIIASKLEEIKNELSNHK